MSTPPGKITIYDLYGEAFEAPWEALDAKLEQSLYPRSPNMLLEITSELGITPEDLILDIGCRDARYACILVRFYHCKAVAIDIVPDLVRKAHETVEQAGLSTQVSVLQGSIEGLPLSTTSCQFIWCRDMLNDVPNLQRALDECTRVLKPQGTMLVYSTFATDLLEPREAAWLQEAFAIFPQNMSSQYMEEAFRRANLRIRKCDMVDSEWREFWEENGTPVTSKTLLQVARLRRRREQLIAEFGNKLYDMFMAQCIWGIYQMLGKLCPMVYLLEKGEK